MQTGIGQLKKLRGKSPRELISRGRQEAAKLSERAFGLSMGEMSDGTFLRHIKRPDRSASAEGVASRIVDRMSVSPFSCRGSRQQSLLPSFGCRAEIVELMEGRFEAERKAIIDRADRAVDCRFDLLGYENLSFENPPDWLLEPISGIRTPLDHWSVIDYLDASVAGDKKVVWELNRLQHFVTLGQAYWMTRDEAYAEAFVSQASSWMEANPPNRGINWASSLELALRSIAWLWALHLFAGSRQISPGFALRSLKYLIAHGRHIESYLSRYFSPNTHLTGEALGLVYLGTALGELRCAEEWRRTGTRILVEELSRQVRADGVYFEQATYYHRYTADFYIHLVALARANSFTLPADVEETLSQMLTHLMWITRPDGSSPLIGDDDGGRLIILGPRAVDDFRDTLATGAALFQRGDWKLTAGDAVVETLWLLGPEGVARYDEIQGAAPRATSRMFDASGYGVMRDGWTPDSAYVLMDCGPHGSLACGHAHADALSIEFAALGTRWIVDPGTLTYTADSESRNWFRSTEAHNTVTVDGVSQSALAGPFSWNHVAQTSLDDSIFGDGFDYLAGSHDGYQRLSEPVRHTREIVTAKASSQELFSSIPGYLIVRDTFSASGRHRYAIRYQLAPECSAFVRGNRVIVAAPGEARLTISVFGESALRARVIEGWVSRAYGRREAAPAAVFYSDGEGPQHFTSLIIPSFEGQSIRVERQKVNRSAAHGFQIVRGEVRDILLVSDGTALINSWPLTADGRFAWARFDKDEFARAFLIRGSVLETSNGFSFRATDPIGHSAFRRTIVGIEGSVNGEDLFDLALCEESHKVVMHRTGLDERRRISVAASAGLRREFLPVSEAIN
jgi:uncharacterized heparinase superfamily protein